ncbi:metal ABC transporter solute-binding protein, Zn/Mn family [Gracilibacillus sp. HCP3S3_G5_1]|uniref:metal ABC transporter solute-binding protein, Zn/Mn family n=1 Tax=unclassified Gracilibacillus TaxID=2625209 RepID=UPI003F8C3BF6
MKKIGIILFFVMIMLLVGCNTSEGSQTTESNEGTSEEKLKIYATLFPLAYFAEEIGGEYVDAEMIIPPGSDAHSFEPTSKMMVDIAEADMFLFNGIDMETYAGTIKDALDGEDVLMLEAADGVSLLDHAHDHGDEEHSHEEDHDHGVEEHSHDEDHDHGDEEYSHEEDHDHGDEEHSHEEDHNHGDEKHSHDGHDHAHGDKDPHVWLDPVRSIDLASNIKDALIELKPEQEEVFQENFEDLEARLTELDEVFQERLTSTENNEILVAHAAYGYWEDRYGIEQIAISGISPSQEPSQKELERIIDHTKKSGIKYLMFEQNIEPNVAQVIQSEANVESLQFHNLEVLTEEDIENEETYFTLMERNLEALTKALDY